MTTTTGAVLPELEGSYEEFSAEEIEQMSFECENRELSLAEKDRVADLVKKMNGYVPVHLGYSLEALTTMTRNMTKENVRDLNADRGYPKKARLSDYSEDPCRIIGKTRADDGNSDIVYLGRGYIGTMTPKAMCGYILSIGAQGNPIATILLRELYAFSPDLPPADIAPCTAKTKGPIDGI